jgi:hypothetical protein
LLLAKAEDILLSDPATPYLKEWALAISTVAARLDVKSDQRELSWFSKQVDTPDQHFPNAVCASTIARWTVGWDNASFLDWTRRARAVKTADEAQNWLKEAPTLAGGFEFRPNSCVDQVLVGSAQKDNDAKKSKSQPRQSRKQQTGKSGKRRKRPRRKQGS